MEKREVKEIFKEKNIKYTKQREMLYTLLSTQTEPIAAEKLFFQLKYADVAFSLSTVYRTLEAFIDKQLVRKACVSNDNRALFELEQEDHKHHLVCQSCRKIVAIEGCPLEQFEKSIQASTDYVITGHHLQIIGLCPKCKDCGNFGKR